MHTFAWLKQQYHGLNNTHQLPLFWEIKDNMLIKPANRAKRTWFTKVARVIYVTTPMVWLRPAGIGKGDELPIFRVPKRQQRARKSLVARKIGNIVLGCNIWPKTPVSNESWINMMLSYCLVGLVSGCSNASGTKWYVDDGPHLNKMYLNTWTNVVKVLLELVQYILWTGKTGENGQSFIRIAKSLWDQTVGSEGAAPAVRISGSLSTGSPVGPLELT